MDTPKGIARPDFGQQGRRQQLGSPKDSTRVGKFKKYATSAKIH